jgi:hypothetical protein
MSAQMRRLHKENMIRMNEPIVSEKLSSVSENLLRYRILNPRIPESLY